MFFLSSWTSSSPPSSTPSSRRKLCHKVLTRAYAALTDEVDFSCTKILPTRRDNIGSSSSSNDECWMWPTKIVQVLKFASHAETPGTNGNFTTTNRETLCQPSEQEKLRRKTKKKEVEKSACKVFCYSALALAFVVPPIRRRDSQINMRLTRTCLPLKYPLNSHPIYI